MYANILIAADGSELAAEASSTGRFPNLPGRRSDGPIRPDHSIARCLLPSNAFGERSEGSHRDHSRTSHVVADLIVFPEYFPMADDGHFPSYDRTSSIGHP